MHNKRDRLVRVGWKSYLMFGVESWTGDELRAPEKAISDVLRDVTNNRGDNGIDEFIQCKRTAERAELLNAFCNHSFE